MKAETIRRLFKPAPLILVLSGMLAIACGDAGRERPNVLLVTFDTMRADHLGCYGRPDSATSVLDELAENAILFEHAYCQAPITLPSHTSILTGVHPPRHGVHLNGQFVPAQGPATLAEVLKESGYATAAFLSAAVLKAHFGLNRGFEVYDDQFKKGPRPGNPERIAEKTTDRALQWLKRAPTDQPFFLWVHYFDPHHPYEPPEPYASQYEDEPYYGEIVYTDDQFGRLLKALQKSDRMDRTLVIVTADHGEGLGDHNERTHALFVYDTTVKVPLIVKPPRMEGAADWESGRRVEQLAQTVDIAPTILAAVGLEREVDFDGVNLLRSDRPSQRVAYAESHHAERYGWAPLTVARTAQWKYIRAPRPELYHVAQDPGELDNQFEPASEDAERLKHWLKEFEETVQPPEASGQMTSDPETLAQLESLGYLGGGVGSGSDPSQELPDPKDRHDVFKNINEARKRMRGGDPRSAVEMLRPYTSQESENATLLTVLGQSYMATGQLQEAIEVLEQVCDLVPDTPVAFAILAEARLKAGDPEGALRALESALGTMPGYASAWDMKGIAHGMRNEMDKALEASRKAVTLEPYHPQYRKNLGVTLMRCGRPGLAEQQFRAALDREPANHADVLFHMGLVLGQQGETEAAARRFEEVLGIEPQHAGAREQLAALDQKAVVD